MSDMAHFVTAVAHANADVPGGADDVAGALIVQNGERVGGGQHRFLNKDAAHLGFATDEEGADEVFFNIEILIEEF